ncbi:MAG: hypothetical protein AMJ65_08965 [Phycisphaerae bacterium SG8_4]|nr:MAG: hypothetical protein AMJ65_08965 [Phycisphaerae bacterium SG8_4]
MSSIDDTTNIACFAVFVRRKNARSRADDGVFRQSLVFAVALLWAPNLLRTAVIGLLLGAGGGVIVSHF